MSTTLDWVRELIPEAQAWQHEMVATNIDGLYTKYYDANDDLYQAKRHIESLRAQVAALKALLSEAAKKMHEDVIKEFPSDLLKYKDIKRSHDLEMDLIDRIYAALRDGE